jgi:DNA polymerase III subunit alpha
MTMPSCSPRPAAAAAAGRIAGAVAAREERKSARGNRFAYVKLSDPTGLYEVMVFADVLEEAREHLEPGRNVVLAWRRRSRATR